MSVKKSNCTESTRGKVIKVKSKGLNCPTMISVEYQVGDVSYVITESIKLKSEMIKIGFFPIGQKKVPVMGETAEGSSAMVNYNPSNPSEAFITNNIGIMNS